jgi:hypothetical protein
MNEKKNKKTGKLINVNVYDINGENLFNTQQVFSSRGQLLRYINQRRTKMVAAITFNNQPVIFDKSVVSKIKIDHEYYLNGDLNTINKTTHQPMIVPVDVIGRLISHEK